MSFYDETWNRARVGPTFFDLYRQTGRVFGDDPDSVVWPMRTQADIDDGMERERSLAKHAAECRRALGLEPSPQPTDLLPLVAQGQFFARQDGTPFTAIECSDFNLFARYYVGEDITPVLQQRQNTGFNMLRVWTDFDLEFAGIGRLLVREHPDAYDRLPAFVRLCAQYGLYVEFTAYTGQHTPDHWAQLTGILAVTGTFALCSLVNENNQHNNTVDVTAFQPVPGLLCSHGSNGADSDTVRPIWDYGEYHTNGLFQWWRKAGHNAMELSDDHPMLAGENTRFPDKDDSPLHAFDAAAGAALLCAGSCFHSVRGKNSTLWSGRELECAQAWADGARSVSLDCQRGGYRHRIDLEGPGTLRVYQRGTNEICLVSIRA